MDRTNVGTKALFGVSMEFDISERIPLITTKKLSYDLVIKELLFFISGKTDTRILEKQGVNIWKKIPLRSAKELGLKYDEGDMGPGYGFQWRHFNEEYTSCDITYTGGIDQLANLIEGLRTDPFSRRHIFTAWNPCQIAEMALPPCHLLAQFNVSADRRWLDCILYQRSGDMFLGVPFNIASYAMLTYMIAHVVGLKPRRLIHFLGDAHIYSNHGEQVKRQLSRTPKPFARLSF